jgi:hypothetical protein
MGHRQKLTQVRVTGISSTASAPKKTVSTAKKSGE